ncbi:hypothetical protein [Porphyromonas gulae]|uniref:hypothetical protein n=1 Tax=Porphyromonas gulae TaxID=111105 RepID=UPI0026ED7A2F|nr:hypothetical protein [Porphyromonas gulae]
MVKTAEMEKVDGFVPGKVESLYDLLVGGNLDRGEMFITSSAFGREFLLDRFRQVLDGVKLLEKRDSDLYDAYDFEICRLVLSWLIEVW